MKLLFIQGGSRVRMCSNETYYVDGNFTNDVWKRYNSYCDNLTVILRKINSLFEEENIKEKLNPINVDLLDLKLVDDVYSPKVNFLNFRIKRKIKKIIAEEVKKNDRIIIRSLGNFYTNTALKYCKKYKKIYLIEVTGFPLNSLWYHSLYGKLVALPRELKLINSVRRAPYAVYVTEKELQKRYPSNGKMLGCSDVELFDVPNNYYEKKKEKLEISKKNNKYVIGTIGFLDVTYKGQRNVIKALKYLKDKGYNNFEYQMIGTGSGKKLKKLINKYNLTNSVKILGAYKHDDIKDWLYNLDIYVHPSYTEGLCRSIIETMGMACPIICTNAGGNLELIDKNYIYKKKNWKDLSELLLKITNNNELINQSSINFKNSKKYNKIILQEKRNQFYMEFVYEK